MREARMQFLTTARGGLVWLACIFFPICVWAQTTTSLNGTVQDSSGAVVAGAAITVDNKSNGFHATRQSDAKGQYEFAQIPPGTYEITARAKDLGEQVKVAELLVSQPATVTFVLSVKAAAETVNVSAATETLNTTDATIGNSVANETIQALPMEGRNVPDLLSLQPGVLYLGRQIDPTVDSRSGAVSGARSDQTNVTLDGVDDNDQTNGFAFTGVLRSTIDSVEEFRVTTASANADAGRNSGAQVVLVTKSGTNQIHGGLYEYNRNTAAVANDWFNKQAELAQGLPNRPGQLIRNTFGGTLGGAIQKNRLFYFVNYEGQRTAENQQLTLTVPTAGLRAGNVTYIDVNQNKDTLTPTQIAGMDPGCTACTYGPGVDPNTLSVFNTYPQANGNVFGDGLNTASFTWSAPNPTKLNTYIAKLDYIAGAHRVFVRGNLQNDKTSGSPQFPGDPPSYLLENNSKGIAIGDVWTIHGNLINSFHYGYIRQGIPDTGAGAGAYVDFVGLSPLNAENRTLNRDVPIHNFIDDITWVKNSHTLQVGANFRIIHNLANSTETSFSSADGNFSYMNLSGIANTGQNFDPGAFGFPAVAGEFDNSYNNAIIAATGMITDINTTSNYAVSANGSSGNLYPQGQMIPRDYKNNEFEYYLQDSWKARRDLTFTFGLRHTLLQTPYEIHGQQVQSLADMQNWFETRTQFAALGQSIQPLIAFAPSGQSRGLKPYWPMNTNNIAPRFAVAYSPSFEGGLLHKIFGSNNRSSLRAGFGMYYDHFGQGIVNSFSQLGSFSLTSTLTSAGGGGALTYPTNAPRYSGINDIPPISSPPASTISYPQYPATGLASQNALGVDDHLQTPYSFAFNTSFQRQIPAGFTLEVAYVGRLGRHLLQQYDWGEPLDLVDSKTGVDYFTAATQLSQLGYSGATTVGPIPYWQDMFPDAAGGGNSATQNVFNQWRTLLGNETFSLFLMDLTCSPGCGGQTNRYFSPQYGALFTWNSVGNSSYNAGQIVLRHPMTHGLQFDFNYTLGKSLDLGSDTERTCQFCRGGVFGPIISTWRPRDNYGVSDFDTRHIVTLDWVYSLPFAEHFTGIRRGVLGGWQLSGLTRWTSGLPFSILQSSNWSTNWTQVSWLVNTGPVKTDKHIAAAGVPQAFADPSAIQNGYQTEYPERNAFPGEAGQRNPFRGDGYFGIDTGLGKSWVIHEKQSVKFAWEIFNVTNSVRFDVHSINNDASSGGFGDYSSTLTAPRVQQFSLRYSF
jgi:carboxypeptidase family protein